MSIAWNSTFQTALPGSSLAHKWGSFPFSRPPQHVDPNEALEKIWKLLHKKDTLKQLWYLLEKGATVQAITKAVIYKLSVEGVIQLNLGVVIYPIVGKMIATLGQAKGINVKLNPEFADKTKDLMANDTLNEIMGNKNKPFNYPKSALDSMKLPKPEDAKTAYENKIKQQQLAEKAKNISASIQQNTAPQQSGLLNMAQKVGE